MAARDHLLSGTLLLRIGTRLKKRFPNVPWVLPQGKCGISADLPSDPEAPWACTKLRGEFNADGPVSVQAETDLPALPSLNLKDFNECDRFSSALKSEGVSLSPSQWNNIKEDDISVEKESRPP